MSCSVKYQNNELEPIEHIPRVPWCITSATDGSTPWRDLLDRACTVVSIGVSDIGVATIGNKKAVFMTLVDRIPRFEA
jgi:hypothetical protein